MIRSGQGRKARTAYATTGAALALDSWLKHRGKIAGPLFLPVLRSGNVTLRRMTDQAIPYILQQWAKIQALITPLPTTCAARSSPISWMLGLILLL